MSRLPAVVLAAVAAAAAAPAAAPAATHTVSTASGSATSVTVTLPRDGRATLTAGDATLSVRARGSELRVDGDSLGRGRDPRAARLIVADTGARVTVTLGPARIAFAESGSRVTLRGRVSVSDRYTSSLGDPLGRLAQRAGLLHVARPRNAAYLGAGLDGSLHFRELRNWSVAFLPGLLWQVAAARGSALHARWAWEEVRDLRRIAAFDDPDVGFVFWRAALRARELGCAPAAPAALPGLTAERCAQLGALARRAGDRLVERSGSNPLGLIPTSADPDRCSQCLPGELRIIVDQLHNLPALTADGDPARVALAHAHARWIAATLIRPDGAVFQEAFITRSTGALVRVGNYQGYTQTSVWSRGQAWAISGLTLAAARFEDPELLAAAVRAADYWLATAPLDGIPRFDFGAPPTAPLDSSALAIAGVGLRELAARCTATGACDGTRYAAAAAAAARTLATLVATGPYVGKLDYGAYTVGGLPWDERAELAWAADFAAQLLAA